MKTRHSRDRVYAEIVEQASAWFVEFSEGALEGEAREQFIQWLRASPEHVRAYLEVSAIWEDSIHLDSDSQTREGLVAAAIAEGSVIPYPVRTPSLGDQQGRRAWFFAAAAFVMLIVFGSGVAFYYANESPSYATGIGEQRSVLLPDGSTVELNARTKIRVEFTAERRTISLIDGQAIFQVAKDSLRPFVVSSGNARISAVGTSFDVYKTHAGTTVTVLEGRVAVESLRYPIPRAQALGNAPAVSAPVLVLAGQQFRLDPAVHSEPKPIDIDAATAWTRRQIVFQSSPLAEVVHEFNRYNPRQMIIAEETLATTRVSGVFSSTDPASLLLFLRQLPDVEVEESDTEIRISRQ